MLQLAVGSWQLSCHQKFRRLVQKVSNRAPESGWPSSDCSWPSYYMLGTTTKLSMPFQAEKNILLRLRSEINIKKVQKQDLKKVKGWHAKKYANKVGVA